jgi:hypothetical protein
LCSHQELCMMSSHPKEFSQLIVNSAVAMSIVGAAFRFQFADNGADFTGGLLNVILVK